MKKITIENTLHIKDRLMCLSTLNEKTGRWEWTGYLCGKYGALKYNGKHIKAHRLSYLVFKGDIAELNVLHKCDNPICINPEHLFLGTQKDNVGDMIKKGRRASTKMELNGRSKLNVYDAIAIRKEYKPRIVSQRNLAKKYSVSRAAIRLVLDNKTWPIQNPDCPLEDDVEVRPASRSNCSECQWGSLPIDSLPCSTCKHCGKGYADNFIQRIQ